MAIRIYNVSYDLNKEKDYPKLWEALQSFSGYSHVLDSTWLICTYRDIEEVADRLVDKVDSDDGILIMEHEGARAGQMPEEIWDWLDESEAI